LVFFEHDESENGRKYQKEDKRENRLTGGVIGEMKG
jgi:hypothetical protein